MIFDSISGDNIIQKLSKLLGDDKSSQALVSQVARSIDLAKFLDSIIEHSDDGIFVCTGKCIAIGANKAYEIISGIPLDYIPGKSVEHLVTKFATSAGSLKVRETHKVNIMTYDFFRTDKKVIVTSTPLFNEEGELTHIVTTLRDITELDRLKKHLYETERRVAKYNDEILMLRNQLTTSNDVIAEDEKTLDLLYNSGRMAKVNATILITGETGVGKEVFAKYIYSNSTRNTKPFVKINCGALPESLIESELFGYEKGAFTGAKSEGKIGLFESADGGTLFLDEVGELSLETQVKLLRVLQEGEIVRIGGNKPIKVDVRIIAATNRDLKEMVEQKLFRQDLYFRLNVIPLSIPPLRERKGDIIPLVKYFLKKANESYGFNKIFTNNTLQLFYKYDWPGNVRELKNMVERVVVMSDAECISPSDLSLNILNMPFSEILDKNIDLKELLEKIEFDYMNKAYEKFQSFRLAAEYLNMTKPTFIRKRNQYIEKFSRK